MVDASNYVSTWSYSYSQCQYLKPHLANITSTIFRIYTMFFDGVVLSLNVYKLSFYYRRRSKLKDALIEQGLIYFIIA